MDCTKTKMVFARICFWVAQNKAKKINVMSASNRLQKQTLMANALSVTLQMDGFRKLILLVHANILLSLNKIINAHHAKVFSLIARNASLLRISFPKEV